MAQTPRKSSFGSFHQIKKQSGTAEVLAEVLAKGIQNRMWKKVVINTSYDHVTRYRNEDLFPYSIIT